LVPKTATRLFLGDASGNGSVNAGDILPMEQDLTNLSAYQTAHGYDVDEMQDIFDVNRDGKITNADAQALIFDLSHGITPSLSAVPEPSSMVLSALGAAGLASLVIKRRRAVVC
jgi:hypothetical protein